MEKRQLNFNAPLLSARRFSSPSNSSELVKRKVVEKPLPSTQQSLPSNKSISDCEEVTKPGAVPFHWEQIPGRCKGEVVNHSHTPEKSSNTLPSPGRLSDASRRNAGEIPKLPPGRVSGPSRYCSGERLNNQNINRPQDEEFSFSDHACLLEKLNESLKNELDSESRDDAFSDALDTLSQTESWSFNYSVSGISGYQSSGVKPSGTFCIDTQTRGFMMNRFLPAAKAVVLETPKDVVKKTSSVLNEHPKQVKKVISVELKPSVNQYSSDILPYYSKYIDSAKSEDEDQEISTTIKKSGKVWGMLARFSLKNSLCLLNSLLSMKSKSRPPSPRDLRNMTRNAYSRPLDKIACQVIHKKKFHSGLLSSDLIGIDNKLTNDSTQFLNLSDSIKSRVSPLRRYRSGSLSPYRNESLKSQFREGVGFRGIPKEDESFSACKIASSRKMFKALQDVSRNQINERGSTVDPVEKMVYVDYVEKKDLLSLAQSYMNAEVAIDNSRKNTLKVQNRDIKLNQSLDQEFPEVPCDAKFVLKEERKLDLNARRESDLPSKAPLPPPLPKSPSESWLSSITLGHPFANSRRSSPIRSKQQGQKGSATNTKWETIVKTSNIRPDHVCYSEELLHGASLRQTKS